MTTIFRGFYEPNTKHVLVPVQVAQPANGTIASRWNTLARRWHKRRVA